MKKYRVFLSLILSATMLFLLCGCNQYKGPYVFWRQSRENIQKVEICTYEDNVQTVIFELPADEVDTFLDEVAELEYLQLIGDHGITGYGLIAIVITYMDGEKEVISSSGIGYISQDGKSHISWYTCREKTKLYSIVYNYVPQDRFPFCLDENGYWIPKEELE